MKSTNHVGRSLRRTAAIATAGVLLTAGLAACSSTGSGSGSTGNASDIAAALQKKSSITVWAWAPQVKDIVKGFEKKYPKITVHLVNAGTGTDEYTKLENAVKAGSGAPDVAQIEYASLPPFALSGDLVDLSTLGLNSVKKDFAQAVWDSVDINGKLVALPQDTGPMALFYNKTVFDKYGISVPTTWDEYVADAQKLHAADPTAYITNDTGDPGFVTSMIWDAGGNPYTVKGTKDVTINFQDAGSKKFADEWNKMIQGDLLSPISSWSTQWYTALGNGSIASLITGAWMPGNLESGVPDASGDWRVAPMPTWTSGGAAATSENGGSSDAVMKQSKNQLVAAGFVQYMNAGAGAKTFADEGGFPSSNSILNSSSFLNQAPAYFGGQKINQVLSASAKSVISGWQFLPFQTYANSIFPDTAGQAYAKKTDLNAGLKAWQDASVSYGNQQGFTVTSK